MTNGAISLIEKNKASPSIASLKRLLDALPMSMADFFAAIDGDEGPKYFYNSDEFVEISPYDSAANTASPSVSLRQLGNASRHLLQMLHETYPPGADTGPETLSHQGEEAGLVIRGEIELTVDGETRTLGPDDGYIFPSHLPHRFRNVSANECEIVSACTPPTF